MKYSTLHTIANAIGRNHYKKAASLIDAALITEPGPAWQRHLGRLALFLLDPELTPFASILGEGNGKLPFLTFGVLPGVSCPGAGDCLNWCYSFKAWRYPAAFAKQAQNLVLVRRNWAAIESAFDKYKARGKRIDFRLYVDGDFDSTETVNLWFGWLSRNPFLITYGYSKSHQAILDAIPAPDNYRLNISSGSNATSAQEAAILVRSATRGRFIAVDIGRPVKSVEHGCRTHQSHLRKQYGKPAFTCPGQCGDCTPRGHACGSPKFDNVDIIIAAH